jgi:hypothetical protein
MCDVYMRCGSQDERGRKSDAGSDGRKEKVN